MAEKFVHKIQSRVVYNGKTEVDECVGVNAIRFRFYTLLKLTSISLTAVYVTIFGPCRRIEHKFNALAVP